MSVVTDYSKNFDIIDFFILIQKIYLDFSTDL